jgi:hypothetical protein
MKLTTGNPIPTNVIIATARYASETVCMLNT